MNTSSLRPDVGGAPIDIRDPRLRVTFADVAMRIAKDGPMYGVILLVGVLAWKGTTTAAESITGAALALLARSHPPTEDVKMWGRVGSAAGLVAGLSAVVIACCP